MDRLVSLTVGTTGAEDYLGIFQDLSELARGMVDAHEYVNVNASHIGEPADDDDEIVYNDHTMYKLRAALLDAVAPFGHGDDFVRDLLHGMQNAGIYFGEKRGTSTGMVMSR